MPPTPRPHPDANGHPRPRPSLDDALARATKRLQLQEARARLRAHQILRARQRKLKESAEAVEWITGYGDLFDRLRGPDRDLAFPFSTAQDRRYGQNWPFWRTWQEHARLRAASRYIVGTSPLAFGVLNALVSYVVGEGMQTKVLARSDRAPRALVECVQEEFVAAFEDANGWLDLQQSLDLDGHVDGEWLLRAFPQRDGLTLLRPVGPEHLLEPPGKTLDEASFGVFTDPEDLLDHRGYWVAYDGNAGNGEYVPASLLTHVKENVAPVVKRGCPDLAFETLDLYRVVTRLLENMGQGSAVQAAIAFIRQHQVAPSSSVADFVSGMSDYDAQRPFSGATENVRRMDAGTVIDMDAGTEFVSAPFSQNIAGYVETVQALLRAVAVRWNAPEWITSADNSSVNFASSLTSESPFVKHCKRRQGRLSRAFRRVTWAALEHWARTKRAVRAAGKSYDARTLLESLELQVVPPTVETRNRAEEAQLNRTYVELGIKDRQTISSELGLDWETVERNNEEYEKKHGEQGVPQKLRTPEDGDGPGGGGPQQPPGPPPPDEPPGGGQPVPDAPDAGGEDDYSDLDDLDALLDRVTESAWGPPGPLLEADGYDAADADDDPEGALLEALLEDPSGRQKGVPWEGKNGRWFVINDAGRVVPAKNPNATKGGGRRAARPTVDEVHGLVARRREGGGKVTPEEAHELAGRIMALTVAQIGELKKRLGVKASGAKFEMATKIAARALDAAREKRQAKPRAPRPAPAPPAAGPDAENGKRAHDALRAILGDAHGVDLGDHEALKQALRKALGGDGDGDGERGEPAGRDPGDGRGSPGPDREPAGDGGPVAPEAGGPGDGPPAEGGDAAAQPAPDPTAGGVPAPAGGDARRPAPREVAPLAEVNRRVDRFAGFFRAKGQHHVADWLGKLKEHVNAVGADAALEALGVSPDAPGGDAGADVQYWGVGTDEANWKHMGSWIEAYLSRNGVVAVTGDASDPNMPLVSALGAPDRFVAGQDFKPADMHFKDKLSEAKTLPGLEASEDVSVIMGGPVTHLTDEVTARLDERYGKGRWIVKCYDDNAAAGYGIFFPQRAQKVTQDARAAIWSAGEHLARYGFRIARDPDTNRAVGLVHESGDAYPFGSEEYEGTIGGDAREWAERARAAADHEQGAMLPEGSFMAQPAFEAVGISDAERAAGKTWHEKNEGRVHLVTRPDGSVEVVPHATWLKGGNLPVVFEDDDTRAMAKAAKEAIEAIPHEARKGQVYAPDVMKTKDGYRVVELNAQGDFNGSGYLHDNHFTIDAYVSHLTGREPAHVRFIREVLTRRKREGAD